MGGYPVIWLSLQGINAKNQKEFENSFRAVIKSCFDEYSFIYEQRLKNGKTLKQEMEKKQFLDFTIGNRQLRSSLNFLIGLVGEYFNKTVVVLIDSYDTAIFNMLSNEITAKSKEEKKSLMFERKKVQNFMRCLLGFGFKDNPHVHISVLTGVLQIYHGLTILSLLHPQKSVDYYGFSKSQVEWLLRNTLKEDCHDRLPELLQSIQKWYGGYLFPQSYCKKQTFNPYSVLSYLNHCIKNQTISPLDTYWPNSARQMLLEKVFPSSIQNNIINLILQLDTKNVKELNFRSYFFITNLNFSGDLCLERISYLLFHLGYITGFKKQQFCLNDTIFALIPNMQTYRVIMREFRSWIQSQSFISEYSLIETQKAKNLIEKMEQKWQQMEKTCTILQKNRFEGAVDQSMSLKSNQRSSHVSKNDQIGSESKQFMYNQGKKRTRTQTSEENLTKKIENETIRKKLHLSPEILQSIESQTKEFESDDIKEEIKISSLNKGIYEASSQKNKEDKQNLNFI